MPNSSIGIGGVSIFCSLEYLGLGVLAHILHSKNQTKKIGKIHKDIKFLCTTFVVNYSNFPNIYSQLLFTRRTGSFGLVILVIHGTVKHMVLNIFKYIFCIKIYLHQNQKRKIIWNIHKAFWTISSVTKSHFHHLLRCHATGINSSFIFF